MSFYIRKSVSVGPLRFNLSKSGIGVSTGVKGFRVGTGPRGNYVHMGRGGIYFRQTIPSSEQPELRTPVPDRQSSKIAFENVEQGDVSQMVDSSSATLLDEINNKFKTPRRWPWALGFTICLLSALTAASSPVWIIIVIALICASGVTWAIYTDKLRKTVVLFYELEPHIEKAFQELHSAFDALRNCARVWHVESRGNITTTYVWKINAGASAIVKRTAKTLYSGAPAYFKCNIAIPVMPTQRRRLFLLPDRILVWEAAGVGAIDFEDLVVNVNERRFIEDGTVPRDSRVVDRTWKYVNKKGGPDKRFNDNREIPIVLYEELLLTSKSGLQEIFQLSRTGIGIQLKTAIKRMAAAISQRQDSALENGYIKCPCNNCEVVIEFPTHGLGQLVACPHCRMETLLFQPSAPI